MRSSKDEKLRTAQISPDTPKIEPVILVVITFAVLVVQAVVEDFAVVFFLVEEAVAVEAEVVMIVEEGGSDRGGRLARELIWGPLLALHTSVHFIAFSTLIVYFFSRRVANDSFLPSLICSVFISFIFQRIKVVCVPTPDMYRDVFHDMYRDLINPDIKSTPTLNTAILTLNNSIPTSSRIEYLN